MEGSRGANLKIPVFSGKQGDYVVWWKRFKAYGACVGFDKCMSETKDPELPANHAVELNPARDEDKLRLGAVRRNNLAMSAFTMAFDTPETMSFVDEGSTDKWPNGLSCEVVKALNREFNPRDAMSALEFRSALRTVSMSPKENPKTLFIQLR